MFVNKSGLSYEDLLKRALTAEAELEKLREMLLALVSRPTVHKADRSIIGDVHGNVNMGNTNVKKPPRSRNG